jgi:hypothetical protein
MRARLHARRQKHTDCEGANQPRWIASCDLDKPEALAASRVSGSPRRRCGAMAEDDDRWTSRWTMGGLHVANVEGGGAGRRPHSRDDGGGMPTLSCRSMSQLRRRLGEGPCLLSFRTCYVPLGSSQDPPAGISSAAQNLISKWLEADIPPGQTPSSAGP